MVEEKVTNLDFVGMIITGILAVMLLTIRRRWAVFPMLACMCYLPGGQQVVFLWFNFSMMRILIFIGWMRLIWKREITDIKINILDKTIVLWIFTNALIYSCSWGTMEAVINRLGLIYTALGLYFMFRFFIKDMEDVKSAIRIIAVVMIPLVMFMTLESFSGENMFSKLGGVPLLSDIRGDRVRAQGPFGNAILAGTFGANQIPLFLGMWAGGGNKIIFSKCGLIAALLIILLSASSGPVLSCVAGLAAICFWPLRDHMKIVRWAIVVFIAGLHFLIMKAPVWYLIARFSGTLGGTGYHRSEIIDKAIEKLSDWWLMGTHYTADWIPYSLTDTMADITNQYIREGIHGGLITMMCFIFIIIISFRTVGQNLQAMKKNAPFSEGIMVWAIGCCLFSHVVTFFSVSYFDQTVIVWYLLLAMIGSLENKLEKKCIELV